MTRVSDIAKIIETLAPQALAADWDHVGVQVGALHHTVKKIYVALDPTLDVAKRAIANHCNLLVTHHPLYLKTPDPLDFDSGAGETIALSLAHRLSIYAAHTNLDSAQGGLNDVLCNLLELENCRPLVPLERVASFEFVGLGRIGQLKRPVPLNHYTQVLKRLFRVQAFRLIASPQAMKRSISRIAVCSGSGASFIEAAATQSADLYITGDIKYHDALTALSLNLPLADLGHFATEECAIDLLAQIVQEGLPAQKGKRIAVIRDRTSRDPFTFI